MIRGSRQMQRLGWPSRPIPGHAGNRPPTLLVRVPSRPPVMQRHERAAGRKEAGRKEASAALGRQAAGRQNRIEPRTYQKPPIQPIGATSG